MKSILRPASTDLSPAQGLDNAERSAAKTQAKSALNAQADGSNTFGQSDGMDKHGAPNDKNDATGRGTKGPTLLSGIKAKLTGKSVKAEQTASKKRLTKKQANAVFDSGYGAQASKDHEAVAKPNRKGTSVSFEEPSEKNVRTYHQSEAEIHYKQADNEMIWHQGAMLRLAKEKNMPVFSKDYGNVLMIWPSGHSYRGHFDKKSGLPGPMGKLTLPNGDVVKSSWQNGRCYFAQDADGNQVAPDVAPVTKFDIMKAEK